MTLQKGRGRADEPGPSSARARRQQQLSRRGRVGGKLIGHRSSGLLAKTSLENKRIEAAGGEIGGERIKVLGPLRGHEHVAASSDRHGDVSGDLPRSFGSSRRRTCAGPPSTCGGILVDKSVDKHVQ
jgi:hypothetical protein